MNVFLDNRNRFRYVKFQQRDLSIKPWSCENTNELFEEFCNMFIIMERMLFLKYQLR